eukprot:GHVN01010467.1.p2 GENE.GHVN01010467.1~~GHVN01010467.1.p2  ORF type:complete len:124 (-),score=4.89 GHVN01010467.1:1079-1450(-)
MAFHKASTCGQWRDLEFVWVVRDFSRLWEVAESKGMLTFLFPCLTRKAGFDPPKTNRIRSPTFGNPTCGYWYLSVGPSDKTIAPDNLVALFLYPDTEKSGPTRAKFAFEALHPSGRTSESCEL